MTYFSLSVIDVAFVLSIDHWPSFKSNADTFFSDLIQMQRPSQSFLVISHHLVIPIKDFHYAKLQPLQFLNIQEGVKNCDYVEQLLLCFLTKFYYFTNYARLCIRNCS